MKAEDEKEFFDKVEDYRMVAKCYGVERYFDVEDLYQAFKARLLSEIKEIDSERD